MNLIDDKLNAKAIVRLLDTHRLTFEAVLPEMRNEVLLLAASTLEGFDEIPRSFHTPEAEAIAAKSLAKKFHHGDQGNDYYKVATKLISGGIGINHIHPDYVDEKIILIILEREDESLDESLRPILNKHREKIGASVLEFVASRSLSTLDDLAVSGFEIKNISSQSLHEGLIKEYWAAFVLRNHGRSDVLALAVKNGNWPQISGEMTVERPSSLIDAIKTRMETPDLMENRIGWLNAYIANYPAAEVAKHMNTNARRSVLLDIFPSEALIDIAKEDKNLSGELLERSMGL
jgi:hypothetical protein